jgi:hypothetical protein
MACTYSIGLERVHSATGFLPFGEASHVFRAHFETPQMYTYNGGFGIALRPSAYILETERL